jgi:hypothetical protein
MDNDWEYIHGRVDPGQDENINLVASVPVTGLEKADLEQRNNLSATNEKSEADKTPEARSLPGKSTDSSFPKVGGPCCLFLSTFISILIEESLLIQVALSRCTLNNLFV